MFRRPKTLSVSFIDRSTEIIDIEEEPLNDSLQAWQILPGILGFVTPWRRARAAPTLARELIASASNPDVSLLFTGDSTKFFDRFIWAGTIKNSKACEVVYGTRRTEVRRCRVQIRVTTAAVGLELREPTPANTVARDPPVHRCAASFFLFFK